VSLSARERKFSNGFQGLFEQGNRRGTSLSVETIHGYVSMCMRNCTFAPGRRQWPNICLQR